MKQLGNSVAVDAIESCGKSLVEYMEALTPKEDDMNNKSNKGEWSELYSMLRLIHDKYLHLADSELEPIQSGFCVNKVKTHNSKNEYVLVDNDEILIKDRATSESRSLKVKEILTPEIQNGEGRSFAINEFEVIKDKLGLFATKGGYSKQKADIVLDIKNEAILKESEGFGIKSYLGGNPTLLNASGVNTNFVYRVEGLSSEMLEPINNITSGQKIKKRLSVIAENGGLLSFDRVEACTMEHNLKMIDTNMCLIIAEMLKKFYMNRIANVSSNIDALHEEGVLNEQINYGSKEHLIMIVKKMLVGVMLGFFTGEKWDGNNTASGTIVVKSDGSQVGYHVIDMKNMMDYLYSHIKFDTASTTRHRFASLIQETDDQLYFKLNLQLRFYP